ncbi:MAG: nucleoside 2-deoxyribosyltransferase domain-containing protein [Bdellovibrionales bacterium]|nr:nucleoside 2-deoxyribosyltransferase domain-containing protein [Bdellovibrionales bacterium]
MNTAMDNRRNEQPERKGFFEVVCPQQTQDFENSLFLAGGITDCPDWQADLVSLISNLPITALNPRRPYFPINDPSASNEQIEWEHRYLRSAEAISFWFPRETFCPITLYELGAWSMGNKALFIGVHPEYPRKIDIEIQTRLARPEIQIVYSLGDLASQIREWRLNK